MRKNEISDRSREEPAMLRNVKLCVVKLCLLAVALCLLSLGGASAVYAQASPSPVGQLSAMVGSAKAVSPGGERDLKKGDDIFESDTIVMSAKSAAKITFKDGSTTAIFENSRFEVSSFTHNGNDEPTSAALNVLEGKVRFFVKPRPKGNDVKFKSSSAVMGVRGTSGYIQVEQGGATRLSLETGLVDFAPAGDPTRVLPVSAGFESVIANARSAPTAPQRFDVERLRSSTRGFGGVDENEGQEPVNRGAPKPKAPDEGSGGANDAESTQRGGASERPAGATGETKPTEAEQAAASGPADQTASGQPSVKTESSQLPPPSEAGAPQATAPQTTPASAQEAPRSAKPKLIFSPDGTVGVVSPDLPSVGGSAAVRQAASAAPKASTAASASQLRAVTEAVNTSTRAISATPAPPRTTPQPPARATSTKAKVRVRVENK